jgi:hypothetical protein
MLFRIYRASHRWSQRQAVERLDYPDADWPDERPPCPCDGAVWSPARAWWFVSVENLEDLLALSDLVGKPVVIRKDEGNRVLVIYDDYLE